MSASIGDGYRAGVDLPLIASGADADVFALGGGLVLRRSRNPRADSRGQAALMEHARAGGYPVPRVHDVSGPDLVLERIDGPTMLDAALGGSLGLAEAGGILAGLLAQLHAIVPPSGTPAGQCLVHLDLHPLNVLLGPDGPVVIDWVNARTDTAGLDLAVSMLIVALAAAGTEPRAGAGRALLEAMAERLGRPDPVSLTRAIAFRSADRNFTAAEREAMPKAADLLSRQ